MASTPTSPKNLAEAAVRQAEQQARQHYSIRLPAAEVDFTLRGRCAGQAMVHRNGQTTLRINLQLLIENLNNYLEQTIPHEVAHLVVNWQHRKARRKPRPHGKEWRNVMQECYRLDPVRCHSYETTPARIVPRIFLYRCSCRDHQLTSIMHNKIRRSYRAMCKSCRSPLKFVSKELI